MPRMPLTSIIVAALLAAHPADAKNGSNGGGNGGGTSGGHGSGGGGGKDGGNGGSSQGLGNGGGKGNSGDDSSGNNDSSGGEKGGRGGQDSGRGGQGDGRQGGGSSKSGGSAEGRGNQGNSTGAGMSGGASSPDAGHGGRGGARANVGGYDNREVHSAEPRAAPNVRAVENTPGAHAASFAARESKADLSLPSSLVPLIEPSRAERENPIDMRTMRAGVSGQIVELCRTSVAAAALRYGAVRVDAAGAGRMTRLSGGELMAPLQVRIVYARANARQVRQSRIACRLNAAGSVVALR